MIANTLRVVLVALALITSGPACAADTDFHYLAADPSLRAGMQNTSVIMGQATYYGQVLSNDQPWEAPYDLGFGSIVTDPDTGQLRMYYQPYDPLNEFHSFMALAVSNDGIHWTKPALNVTGTTYTTNPLNNFVSLPQTWMGAGCVFIDPNAPAGSPRYRMSVVVNEKTLYSLTSSNGVNWSSAGLIDDRGSNWALDSLNVTLWDPKTQKYTLYGRWGYDGLRRGVYMKQSDTWGGTWTGARQFILDPKNVIPAGGTPFDIYSPCVQLYHGQYVGLPAIYYHPGGGSGPVYPTLMYSRDGTHFSFEDPYHPMIDLSAHGQNQQNFGQAYPGTTMVERDGLLYIYYEYFPGNHNAADPGEGKLFLATLPVDRFVGIQSTTGNVGEWTTLAITLPSDPGHLIVNAQVNGSVQVEVLNPTTGQPFPGYGQNDTISIPPGDFLNALARWNGADNLNSLAGQTVELRFLMNDATIYGFHFGVVPEPSTLVLLVAGLIGLLCYAWRKRR